MAKLLTSLTFVAALSTISLSSPSASADPTTSTSLPMMVSHRCEPGTQVACSCGDGGQGTGTCSPSGAGISVCACARVIVNVPVPVVPVIVIPDFRMRQVRVRRRYSPPMPGLALLLGGAFTLGTGAFNVAFGVERIRDYGADPFGIVSVSLGGTAMLIGLPLTIIGIVRYATEPKEPDTEKEDNDVKTTSIRFAPTADGFAVHF